MNHTLKSLCILRSEILKNRAILLVTFGIGNTDIRLDAIHSVGQKASLASSRSDSPLGSNWLRTGWKRNIYK
jgi:hypothetical protein